MRFKKSDISRNHNPKIGRTNLEIRLLIVKLYFTILDIFWVEQGDRFIAVVVGLSFFNLTYRSLHFWGNGFSFVYHHNT